MDGQRPEAVGIVSSGHLNPHSSVGLRGRQRCLRSLNLAGEKAGEETLDVVEVGICGMLAEALLLKKTLLLLDDRVLQAELLRDLRNLSKFAAEWVRL